MRSPVRIERLNAADIDRVMEIEEASFRYPWPRAFFVSDLASPQSISLAAWCDGQLVSYGLGMVAAVELHVTNIAVAREYQRRGFAQRIIGELENAGRERGCGYAYLEVRVSNRPAIELYKKVGYQSAYTRKGYYLDGEDALVMEKVL